MTLAVGCQKKVLPLEEDELSDWLWGTPQLAASVILTGARKNNAGGPEVHGAKRS